MVLTLEEGLRFNVNAVLEELLPKRTTQESESQTTKTTQNLIFKPLIGYFLVILSALLLCLQAILSKMAYLVIASDQLMIRYSIQLVFSFYIITFNKLKLFGKPNERKLLFLRGIWGGCSALMTFYAVKLINPSDYITIINSSVVFTVIVFRLFIKEKLTIIHLFAILLTISGIVCIFRPKFLFDIIYPFVNTTNSSSIIAISSSFNDLDSEYTHVFTIVGIISSILVAIFFALSNLFMKKLSNLSVHYAIVAIYPTYLTLPVACIISFSYYFRNGFDTLYNLLEVHQKLYITHIWYSIGAALSGSIAIYFINLSFNYEDASRIAIVKTIDVFFSFLLQYFILGIQYDLLGIIGASLILAGTFLIILFKLIENHLQHSNKCFKIFTIKF